MAIDADSIDRNETAGSTSHAETLGELALPRAATLSHHHPNLRNDDGLVASQGFSPSQLLCSLLPNSLPSIAKQLADYEQVVSRELQAVVDAEYRDFIDLASRLAGERQRIDRLAHWATGLDHEGLEGVRKKVVQEKEQMNAAQTEVENLLRVKSATESRRSHLRLLVSFTSAIHRLESLLAIEPPAEPSSLRQTQEQRRKSSIVTGGVQGQTSRHLMNGENIEEEEEEEEDRDIDSIALQLGDESDMQSSEDGTGLALRTRHDDTVHSSPAESVYIPGKNSSTFRYAPIDSLDMPTRIARAKSCWEQLTFLKKTALSSGLPRSESTSEVNPSAAEDSTSPLSPFISSHDARLRVISERIKVDIKSFVQQLLSPASLLVGSPVQITENDADRKLRRWSQISNLQHPDEQYRLRVQEQSDWLTLALDTWIKVSVNIDAGVAEIRDEFHQQITRPWLDSHLPPSSEPSDILETPEDPEPLRAILLEGGEHWKSPFLNIFNDYLRKAYKVREIMKVVDDFDNALPTRQDALQEPKGEGNTSSPPFKERIALFEEVIWAKFARGLAEKMGSALFFVGRANEFHRNFELTQKFLDSFEKMAPSPKAAASWRHHESYAQFAKRWQLSVFFQMRSREIVSRYEESLKSTVLAQAVAAAAIKVPLLDATKAALSAFAAPWEKGSHLAPLSAKQWRLSLLIAVRMHSWYVEQVPKDRRIMPNAQTSRLGIEGSQVDGPGPQTPRAATPDAASLSNEHEHNLKACSILAADSAWFNDQMMKVFDDDITGCLPRSQADSGMNEWQEIAQNMRSALEATFPFRTSLLQPISEQIVGILKSRCAEPLRLVRSVSATSYRNGSGNAATNDNEVEPSYFVPLIFRPLRQFLGKGDRPGEKFLTTATLISRDVKADWATSVIEDVATKYAASLDQMMQNYESLKRLKRGGGAGSGGFGGLASSLLGRAGQAGSAAADKDADRTRMQAQMLADIQCLEQDVLNLQEVDVEVDLSASAAWKSLRGTLQRREF